MTTVARDILNDHTTTGINEQQFLGSKLEKYWNCKFNYLLLLKNLQYLANIDKTFC